VRTVLTAWLTGAVVVISACTGGDAGRTDAGQHIHVQTGHLAIGTSPVRASFGAPPIGQSPETVAAPPGTITSEAGHAQRVSLIVGEQRAFRLRPDGPVYFEALRLAPDTDSKPGVVTVAQSGGYDRRAALVGNITASAPGVVTLSAEPVTDCQLCGMPGFVFTLTVTVTD
jgi:hypothetical protein